MVPFGGWEMPLSYETGTLDEHRRCRADAVVFDVSHLGTVRVAGAGAYDLLQRTLTNDLAKIGPGRAQYTHLLDPADASVVDDIIVWWIDETTFDVMPNASNTDGVTSALSPDDCSVDDITPDRAVLAVQGPAALERFATVHPDAAAVGRFRVGTFGWEEFELHVAGTGYTGEPGIECAVPVDAAARLWDAILAAGVTPAGLGARDTLRLEAGLPLHGNELGPGISPLQAGLSWVVGWDKPEFRGREALLTERETGVARRLRGLTVAGRRPPRSGQSVCRDAAVIGQVTSGNFSPMLEQGIALAFVPPDIEIGERLEIDQRGTAVTADVVDLPFWPKP